MHHSSELHSIDFVAPDELQRKERFERNVEHSGNGERVYRYLGNHAEILGWMAATDGFWESFDFIHITCLERRADTLLAACGSWCLLSPGGVMAFSSVAPDSKFGARLFGEGIAFDAKDIFNGPTLAWKKRIY